MSADISGNPGTSKRVRYHGGVREEREEEKREEESMDCIYEEPDSLRDQGSVSQGVTGDQVVQRELTIYRDIVRACAVCLTLLFAIFTVRTVDMAMDYKSANLTLEREQFQSRYDNQTLKIIQLQTELNQCRGTAVETVKSCPCGWKTFEDSCYYRSTEEKTWEESREQCVKAGAHLVIINNEEEQEFIRGLSQGDVLSWVGLKKTEEKWTWVDGTPQTTGNRVSGQYGDCAYYWHGIGELSSTSCSFQTFWICEKFFTD